MDKKNILIVEPYFAGSHASWIEGFKASSRHSISSLTLPGRLWKWRMHGGAVTLADRFIDGELSPDLIVATDMLDLTTFLALTRAQTHDIPTAVYFHENQLTYPWSPNDRDVKQGRDQHYAFINFSTALSADRVFFNSNYHMEAFLEAITEYLHAMPEALDVDAVEKIRKKSAVLYPGVPFTALDEATANYKYEQEKPLILWNHRWEHDKNPEDFFSALYALADRGLDFEVAILGDNFKQSPKVFTEAKETLGARVIKFGFAEDRAEYARWLMRADILPVTSIHDFFGFSVVEAIYMNCFPLLPDRLAYPEHIPAELQATHLYSDQTDLIKRLGSAITNINETRAVSLKKAVEKYCWKEQSANYDAEMERLILK